MNQLRGYISLLVIILGALAWHYIAKDSTNRIDIESLIKRGEQHLGLESQRAEVEIKNIEQPTAKSERKLLSINLNLADTTTLKRVYGIGSVYAQRIVEYREELGGFNAVEQLQEIKGMFRENYERIYKNFFIDTLSISKIYINFAPHSELLQHPYITKRMADRIVKAQKKGGYFTSYQELIDNDILLKQEALRVAPYLAYDTIRSEKN